jgi:hypothetical protein
LDRVACVDVGTAAGLERVLYAGVDLLPAFGGFFTALANLSAVFVFTTPEGFFGVAFLVAVAFFKPVLVFFAAMAFLANTFGGIVI